jgi:hypothetical protein
MYQTNRLFLFGSCTFNSEHTPPAAIAGNNKYAEEYMFTRPETSPRFTLPATQALRMMIALFALLLSFSAASAQVLYGSLTGTVADKTGAVVPYLTVTVTNEGTGAVRTTKTNTLGSYALRDILPGTYGISVAKQNNFAAFNEKNVAINANEERRIDITLALASVTAEVTVDTAPPMLQTETAEINNDITATQLEELPVTSTQGRNFQSLYNIIPGSNNVAEQNSTAGNPSRAMSVNINGMSDMSNVTRIDGAMNIYGWLPYLIAYVPPADAIETVNMVTNSFNAEQGVAGGASINITVKSGTSRFHGSTWEYNQIFNTNALGYTTTRNSLYSATNPNGEIPKNIMNQWGFTVGGPVYIPHFLTGKKKLFFFQDFERTTRRQLITGQQTVPDLAMAGGDFSAVDPANFSGTPQAQALLYDPINPATGAYVPVANRVTFKSEYGSNAIPAARLSSAAQQMMTLLKPISTTVGAASGTTLAQQMVNDYTGTGALAYNRNTEDTKITYIPSENTQIFGRYSYVPFTVSDPQQLGAAGGGTWDGGQPGAAQGKIRNVGLGMSHVFSQSLVLDADFGYTRQRTGAVDPLDQADGNYGLNVLKIPGTNGTTADYYGLPQFSFTGFSSIGNSSGANPFLFRDNQFTADANLSWTKGRHAMRAGFTYYHFDLNHFQPSGGGGLNNPRGAFQFQGGLTTGPADLDAKGNPDNINNYLSLADFLLGMPNNGSGAAVGKINQLFDPNTLRWSQYGGYAQDQWAMTPKLTVNFGARYDFFPMVYKDHEGVAILDPTLPQSANVELGGLGGNPENAGVNVGHGMIEPRLGVVYRLNNKLVVRSGGGITEDSDSPRFMRDSYPSSISNQFSGAATDSVALDSKGNPITLVTGIPALVTPNLSTGFASLPISGATTTIPKNFKRGYIESWNLSVQDDLGKDLVLNVAYVGTHQIRQMAGVSPLNASALPDANSPCMANGYWNPSTGLTGKCGFQANQTINQQWCSTATTAAGRICYNTGGINISGPAFSSNYNGLQSQLTRNARNESFGVVYTWSHAFDYEDNGAGSGSAGTAWNFPAYYKYNRASAGYDHTHNFQFWGIYHLPFGPSQAIANHGLASAILGGFQLNGQASHVSGSPFTVSAASNTTNSQGNPLYANLTGSYKQLGGHYYTPAASYKGLSAAYGTPWFDPTIFSNPTQPVEPTGNITNGVLPTVFGNTHRNQFRGPGQTVVNASAFRSFPLYHELKFDLRFEAFNVLNHPILNTPNTTVGAANFGQITSFGAARTVQYSGRFTF